MALEDYDDPAQESVLSLAPSGSALVLVSDRAHITTSLKNRFDKQTKAGQNFGRVKFLGTELAEFTVHFEVLAGFEENLFSKDVLPLLRRKGRNGTSPPFDVFNAQIQRLGIDTVTIVSAEIGPPNARTGRLVTLQLEEWAPAPVEPKELKTGKENIEPLDINAGNATPVEVTNQG